MNKQDSKITGASYLWNFYLHVGELNNEYANYVNSLLYLENKYGGLDDAAYDEADKASFTQQLQILRYWVNKTHIIYTALIPNVKREDKLTPLHEKLSNTFVINRDIVKQYVQEANAFLAEDVISALLRDNEELINEIFNE